MKQRITMGLFFGLWVLLMGLALGLPDIAGAQVGPAEFVIENALNDTGAFNVIASVITDYRAFDTLGETLILFVSIVCVLSILHRPKGASHGQSDR
jgi:multisubunit Na+/H+ antiporter MnhB subunit